MKKIILSSAFAVVAAASQAVWINEVQPNPAGSDPSTQAFEFKGTAGDSFSGFLLSLESDAGSSAGLVDRIYQIGGTFDTNGLLLTGLLPDLENPSLTLVLVDAFTGSTTTDFDSNNDGVIDLDLATVGITTVFDAIGVPDAAGEAVYGAALGGADFSHNAANTGNSSEPLSIFRDGVSNTWYAWNVDNTATNVVNALDGSVLDAGSFDIDPFATTFGNVNPTVVPEPATMTVVGLGLAALLRRRNKKA